MERASLYAARLSCRMIMGYPLVLAASTPVDLKTAKLAVGLKTAKKTVGLKNQFKNMFSSNEKH